MSLNLTIENESRLPDGGSLTYNIKGDRGADIGRDTHLDWTLPDPSRCISGKHCEIRYRDGGYWLSDISRNGTFLNGDSQRIQSPYRLRRGDRLAIGHYIIVVDVTAAVAPETPKYEANDYEDLWRGTDAAPPVDRREMRPAAQAVPIQPDFLEWAVDLPNSPGSGFIARPAVPTGSDRAPSDPMSWDAGPVIAHIAEPEPLPQVPSPRRSIWVSQSPAGHWVGENAAPSEPPVSALKLTTDQKGTDAWSDIVARFARGAGLPSDTVAFQDPGTLAETLGRLLLLVTDNLKQLLHARSQTKQLARSANQTIIMAVDNNPLKFSPTAADALRVMLGPPNSGYLDADRALQQGFDDLKTHQMKTFAAMQNAMRMLLQQIDPATIEKNASASKWSPFQKARLWTLYQNRWRDMTCGGDMQSLFMQLFTDAYDSGSGPAGG